MIVRLLLCAAIIAASVGVFVVARFGGYAELSHEPEPYRSGLERFRQHHGALGDGKAKRGERL